MCDNCRTPGSGGEKYVPYSARKGNESIVYFTRDLSAAGLKKWVQLAKNKQTAQLVTEFAEAVYSDELLERSRPAFRKLAEMVTDSELERFIAVADGIAEFDNSPHTKDIRCPVLVIGGAKDKLISQELLPALAQAANAGLYVYEDGVHSVYDEMPDFKQRVLDFFMGE